MFIIKMTEILSAMEAELIAPKEPGVILVPGDNVPLSILQKLTANGTAAEFVHATDEETPFLCGYFMALRSGLRVISLDESISLPQALTHTETDNEPAFWPGQEEEIPEDPDEALEFVKEMKIKEMSNTCRQTIIDGVDVELSDGKTHHFSLEIEDQIKIQALALKAQQGEEKLYWHPDGELCQFYSAEDILRIYAALEETQTVNTTYFNSLRNYIQSMTSIEQVGKVVYGMGIPEEYQSEVLKYLLKEGDSVEGD